MQFSPLIIVFHYLVVVWLVGRLVVCLFVWLVGCSVSCLVGWLFGGAFRLDDWFVSYIRC